MVPNELTSRWLQAEDLIHFLEMGDLIEFRRVVRDRHHVYTHWAVYLGFMEGVHLVIHLSNGESDFGVDMDLPRRDSIKLKLTNQAEVTVRTDEFAMVAGPDFCRINNDVDSVINPFPPVIIRDRALQYLGTGDYSILSNNCEHFAKWARYGSRESRQATVAKSMILGSTALVLTGSFTAGLTATAVGFGLSYAATRLRRHFSFMPQIFR
ncbi:hypothetical protein L596_026984 [Steinernema carpocapsae]|uniref:LRAT domain-containing protein n=1 Tax=Steinernema carpocapsae TaxID=34508 RepID=A0A4U5M2Z0_STECR|nr:hypothetical protein L596_026984 [Steinernema carpocapsae]